MNIKNGSLFLGRLLGVNLYVHWSWLIVAIIQIYLREKRGALLTGDPRGVGYQVALYLCLFGIVLIHEFGHALACKSVGGRAEEIMLWPLGGVAYVQPPQRPGAFLWSIAAGPLVNVVLLPLTIVPAMFTWQSGAPYSAGADFLFDVALLNVLLLVFNMLPFYPLDGGQILRSLIWFVAGRALSLVIATIIGLVGAVLLGLLALWLGGIYLGVMVFFMGSRSLGSLRVALQMYRMENAPRREEAVCPMCRQHPPFGPLWRCACGMMFDTFETGATCPHCRRDFSSTMCPFCQQSTPLTLWYPHAAAMNMMNVTPPPVSAVPPGVA